MTRFHGSIVAIALVALLFAGCAQTTVIREPEPSRAGRTHAERPHPAQPPARNVQAPAPGSVAVVHAGETIYRIATEHGISPLDLAMWNRIAPPYTIHPGQKLRLTPPSDARPVAAAPSTSPATTGKPPVTTPPATTPPASTASSTNAGSANAGTTNATPANTSPAPANGGATNPPPVVATAPSFDWRWPADGAIVERFAAGDPTRQGIDIAGKSGSPVRAAADGVVVYSGAGLVGYGELIIIKHNDQWLTAYGHNRARLVNEGQRVKAGDQIAEMGRSGAARDMLHFEIRFNGKPQDPLQALPKR